MRKLLKMLTAEDYLILGSMVLTLAGIILGAALGQPSFFGFTALATISLLIVGWIMMRSARLGWLLLFGLVTGVLELWSDWLHVTYFHSLVYTDYFGFRLLASPSYMPIGWWLTTVQFGYLVLRLHERWASWLAVGLLTGLGMCLPPWYEELAAPARAWYYPAHGLMLSHTPLWVIATYGGCMFAITTLALEFYRPRCWQRALLAGLYAGASIMFSAVLCFAVLARV